MRIVLTVIEASEQSAIGSYLEFLGHEPIACVSHHVQRVNLLLVDLRIDELIVVGSMVVGHVGFDTLLEISVYESLQTIRVVRQLQSVLPVARRFQVGIAHCPLHAIGANHGVACHRYARHSVLLLIGVAQLQAMGDVVRQRHLGSESPEVEPNRPTTNKSTAP